MEKTGFAATLGNLLWSLNPTYSIWNFCWLTAVGARRAASTPFLNHFGVRSIDVADVLVGFHFVPDALRLTVTQCDVAADLLSYLQLIGSGNLAV